MFLIAKSWYELLKDEFETTSYKNLTSFLEKEYTTKKIYPKPEHVFNALNYVKPGKVKVVIIGQDPYHQPNQAHGLSFSVQDGVVFPPSLRNIFKEVKDDIGTDIPTSGNLTRWAEQGVLLLNTILTVEEGKPNSHKGKGWEKITSKIIKIVNEQEDPCVFLLWGAHAKAYASLINKNKHFILTANHPSPMSANNGGWFGNKCFSKTNQILTQLGKTPIKW